MLLSKALKGITRTVSGAYLIGISVTKARLEAEEDRKAGIRHFEFPYAGMELLVYSSGSEFYHLKRRD